MTIRAYHTRDWLQICEVHDSARRDELRLSVGESAFLSLEETAGPEGLFDAALDVLDVDGRVRGFVAYSQTELTWLYVAPDSYRKGFGRRLLRHAVSQAGPIFRTEVLEGNLPATGLYLSEGFALIERRVGRLEGNDAYPATGLILERRRPV